MFESLGTPVGGPGDSLPARTPGPESAADRPGAGGHIGTAIALSLIVPAYNEARRLPPYLEAIRHYLDAQYTNSYEVIVVDDGGSDHLLETLTQICGAWPQFVFIRHPRNLGKGAAVRTGVQAARGDRILFADADGATPIDEERKLCAALAAGAELAIGSRLTADSQVVRRRSWGRAVLGRAFAAVARRVFSLSVRDTQCGFKMFRRGPAGRLFALSHEDGYLFDIEILALAQQLGYRIAEVPINWADRPGSRLHLWRDAGRILAGLQRLRRRLKGLQLDYDSTSPT
jgi:dolichyl-phosphate beta-glucosyltransferase